MWHKATSLLTAHRRRIYIIAFIACFLLLVRFFVLRWTPAGYTQLECLLSPKDVLKMEKLIDNFAEVAQRANFTWWIDYGTLLGVTRTGTLIPWDKDVDASTLEDEMPAFHNLAPELKKRGLLISGLVVVYSDDYALFSQDPELVVAKLEMFPLVRKENQLVRTDLQKYLDPKQQNLFDRFWWFLLRMTGVSVLNYDDIFPLKTATMYHYPTDPVNVTERAKHWHRVLPAPNNPPAHLANLYGSSWNKQVKWKFRCYL